MRSQAAVLASELTGDLPCARCRYNLRGLSVRGTCPECGVPVRATLLAKIDPHASEIQPLVHPYLSAVGMQVWAFAALLAALATWLLRGADLAYVFGLNRPAGGWPGDVVPRAVPILILISGVGACALIRPHGRIRVRFILAAAASCAAYLAVALIAWRIHVQLDAWSTSVLFGAGPKPIERSLLRIASDVLIAAIALGLRPNARLLVGRSMLLRSGNVDRQTLAALAGASLVSLLGDLIHVAASMMDPPRAELVRLTGTMLIGLGSTLLTIGLIGVAWDCVRLWPATVAPPLSLEDVVGDPPKGRGGT